MKKPSIFYVSILTVALTTFSFFTNNINNFKEYSFESNMGLSYTQLIQIFTNFEIYGNFLEKTMFIDEHGYYHVNLSKDVNEMQLEDKILNLIDINNNFNIEDDEVKMKYFKTMGEIEIDYNSKKDNFNKI